MSKEIQELKGMSDNELLKRKKDMEFLLMGSYAKVKPLIPPTNRGRVRRSIARINTLLGERGRRGFNKNQNEKTKNI